MSNGRPIIGEELEKASSQAPDSFYDRALILMALAEILERLVRIEQQQKQFECRGGPRVYD